MNRVPRARYAKEFRAEAIKLAGAEGASEVSRRLSIPLKSPANWQQAAEAGKPEEVGRNETLQTELEPALQRTRRELVEVKM